MHSSTLKSSVPSKPDTVFITGFSGPISQQSVAQLLSPFEIARIGVGVDGDGRPQAQVTLCRPSDAARLASTTGIQMGNATLNLTLCQPGAPFDPNSVSSAPAPSVGPILPSAPPSEPNPAPSPSPAPSVNLTTAATAIARPHLPTRLQHPPPTLHPSPSPSDEGPSLDSTTQITNTVAAALAQVTTILQASVQEMKTGMNELASSELFIEREALKVMSRALADKSEAFNQLTKQYEDAAITSSATIRTLQDQLATSQASTKKTAAAPKKPVGIAAQRSSLFSNVLRPKNINATSATVNKPKKTTLGKRTISTAEVSPENVLNSDVTGPPALRTRGRVSTGTVAESPVRPRLIVMNP